MNLSPEVLMAYVDGELDPASRREVEAAMASDARIAREIARLKAQRSELEAAFSGVLREPMPESLLDSARTAPTASAVTDLSQVRARKEGARAHRWSPSQWAAIAASVLIGVLVGRVVFGPAPSSDLVARDGRIVAHGRLAAALFERVGTSQADGIAIGISYRAKSGEYCRTFATGTQDALAGIACRESRAWRVQALATIPTGTTGAEYRPAGTNLPPAILRALEASIDGEALDAREETDARARSWRP